MERTVQALAVSAAAVMGLLANAAAARPHHAAPIYTQAGQVIEEVVGTQMRPSCRPGQIRQNSRCQRVTQLQCLDHLAYDASDGDFDHAAVRAHRCGEAELLNQAKQCRPMTGDERKAKQNRCKDLRF